MVIEAKPKNLRGSRELLVMHVDKIINRSNKVVIILSKDQNNLNRIKTIGLVYKSFDEERGIIEMTPPTYFKQVVELKHSFA